MSLTSAAAVHTRRRPVGSDCWSPPPFWSGGGMFLTGGPLGGVDGAGCGGTLPAGGGGGRARGGGAERAGPVFVCALAQASATGGFVPRPPPGAPPVAL